MIEINRCNHDRNIIGVEVIMIEINRCNHDRNIIGVIMIEK
jgi:hypothetical protein